MDMEIANADKEKGTNTYVHKCKHNHYDNNSE